MMTEQGDDDRAVLVELCFLRYLNLYTLLKAAMSSPGSQARKETSQVSNRHLLSYI